jgi:hypothetical protein
MVRYVFTLGWTRRLLLFDTHFLVLVCLFLVTRFLGVHSLNGVYFVVLWLNKARLYYI